MQSQTVRNAAKGRKATMSGRSPLDMMRAPPRRGGGRPVAPAPRRKLRLALWIVATAVALAVGWSWLWYYAASVAERTLAAWVAREAAAGRQYSCGSQAIGGYPFSIETNCRQAAGVFNSNRPPFDVRAKAVTFSAQVFRPTVLTGDITGPVTLADPGQAPVFVGNWSHAQITLLGLPPDPQRIAVSLDDPQLERAGLGKVFAADSVTVDGRIIEGTARNNPVIEATVEFAAATAPTVHPLLEQPLQGRIDAVLRGLKDFAPKPWPERFREIQAAGGDIEIRALRLERPDAVIVGDGTLTLNEHGKLDGTLQVTVAGIENIVPLLGLDRLIGQGINRLTGASGPSAPGLGALDRLMPGLSGVVREGANAGVIDNIKRMGRPAQIDQKPAVALPVRVNDGVISLGVIPLGEFPALF